MQAKKMLRIGPILFVLASILSCNSNSQRDKQASQLIDQLYQQFEVAYDSLDTDMVSNLYAKEAFYLMPHRQAPILKGRKSIRESFFEFISGAANNNHQLDITFRIISRKISDSLAFDVGYYHTRSKADTAAAFPEKGSVGKFVTVMGLTPDGSWKFLLDGYNSAPYEAFAEAESAHDTSMAKPFIN